MKVWVCQIGWDYEGTETIAVTTTLEQAKEYEKIYNDYDSEQPRCGDYFEIIEVETDTLVRKLYHD